MEIENIPEISFQDLAEQRKYKVFPASKDQVRSGIDFVVKGVYRKPQREVTLLFAVKRKKTKKKQKRKEKKR